MVKRVLCVLGAQPKLVVFANCHFEPRKAAKDEQGVPVFVESNQSGRIGA
jgi:hypothetical protein